MKTITFILLMLAPVGAFTTFDGFSKLPDPLPKTNGKQIFQDYGCIHCHGMQGKGDGMLAKALDPKPRNFASYKEMKNIPDSLILHSIRHGVKGSAMPANPNLTDEEIESLRVYIRSFLADYYHTVNMCVADKHTVYLDKALKDPRVIVDDPNKVTARVQDGALVVQATNPIKMMQYLSKNEKRTTRNGIRLSGESENGTQRILITVRIHDCIRGDTANQTAQRTP